ncbi:hypothetical protein MNBD_NITROSPINAE01-3 [hydrothermal vent metagenome]|uniref:NAD-dependent epimerase/dehydratase domain-containing protein n=1 Tax=hydrothermal vent metagenome TaxID=652676 RepID=A0A3B1C2K4_9ZZZZ
MKHSQSIIITGATSQIGFFLLPKLAQEKYKTYAISRNPEKRASLYGSDIIWIKADKNNDIEWEKVNNLNYLIYIAPLWTLPRLLPSIAKAGISRVIAFSSTSLYGKADSSNLQEAKTVTHLMEAEQNIKTFCQDNNIAWTIFQPTLIYGAGMDKNITTIANLIKRFHFFPLIGKGIGLRQPVHAKDLAEACMLALNNRLTFNKTYILAGGEVLNYHQMVERIFCVLEIKPRFINIPLLLYKIALRAMSKLPKYKHLTPQMADRMNMDLNYDTSEAIRDFEYHPSKFTPSFKNLKT